MTDITTYHGSRTTYDNNTAEEYTVRMYGASNHVRRVNGPEGAHTGLHYVIHAHDNYGERFDIHPENGIGQQIIAQVEADRDAAIADHDAHTVRR